MKPSDGSGKEIGWEENKELARLVWVQEAKEKAPSEWTLGLVSEIADDTTSIHGK